MLCSKNDRQYGMDASLVAGALCLGEHRFWLVSDFHLATDLHANKLQVNIYPNYPQVTLLGGGHSNQWTDCIIDKIFKNIEIVKFIVTALISILNLVKWQSLVAKCSKVRKV